MNLESCFWRSGTLPLVGVQGPEVRVQGPEIGFVVQRILELKVKKKFFGWLLGWLNGLDKGSRKRQKEFFFPPQLPINYIIPCHAISTPADLLSTVVD